MVLMLEPALVAAQVYMPEVLWLQECRVLRVLQLQRHAVLVIWLSSVHRAVQTNKWLPVQRERAA
jgi:hypothetical protein